MKKIRIGLLGCGKMGRRHAECISKIKKAETVAYSDAMEESATKLLSEFGGSYATTDNEKIIKDPNIQAVYICTQNDSHASLSIAAAKANKHILIEKPLALSMEECLEIEEAVNKSGVNLMGAFKMRFYPLIQKAKDFIPNPIMIVGQMMDNRWEDDRWPQDPVTGGANVQAQGCHMTDLFQFMAQSTPKKIIATGGAVTHPGHPCLDQCAASITFNNGCFASWIQGDACMSPFTGKLFLEVFGNGRSVTIYDRFKKATFFNGEKEWVEEREEEEGFQLENEEFISALMEGREPVPGVQDGIYAQKMVLAAIESIRTGKQQEF